MIENSYDLNEGVHVGIQILNAVTGVGVDPGTLMFEYKNPAGIITSYVYGVDSQLARDSAGNYHVDILGNVQGIWWWRWEATNPYKAKEEAFIIKPSQFS